MRLSCNPSLLTYGLSNVGLRDASTSKKDVKKEQENIYNIQNLKGNYLFYKSQV